MVNLASPRQADLPESEAASPLVSVITATWNAAATLQACLRSVASQDYSRIEHIVVDGASNDGTLDVLREHAGDRVRWVSEPDRGIYDAWNKGLRLAQGKWIAFLGADDVYLPGAVSAYMKLAAQHPEARYLSGQVRWRRPTGDCRLIGERWRWPRFQRYMCTAHVGSMHHRELFERFGTYDDSLRIVADYEFLLRAGDRLDAQFLPVVTAEMQSGGASDSLAAIEETARVKRSTGGRLRLLVALERWRAAWGFRLRQFLYRRSGTKA